MKRASLWCLLLVIALAGCDGQPGGFSVTGQWVLEAPGGTSSMAGYGELANGTDEPVTVTGAESPAFERVHFHETRLENGQARMSPVDSLTLPPGGRAVMRPGGLHLMLMQPRTSLESGDRVEIRFHLSGGDTVAATFPVRPGPPTKD